MLCVTIEKRWEYVLGTIFKYKDHFYTCKSEFYKLNETTPKHGSHSEETSTFVTSKHTLVVIEVTFLF